MNIPELPKPLKLFFQVILSFLLALAISLLVPDPRIATGWRMATGILATYIAQRIYRI